MDIDPKSISMPRHRTREERIPDHEVLLVFNADAEAEFFDEWWHLEGRDQFIAAALAAPKEG